MSFVLQTRELLSAGTLPQPEIPNRRIVKVDGAMEGRKNSPRNKVIRAVLVAQEQSRTPAEQNSRGRGFETSNTAGYRAFLFSFICSAALMQVPHGGATLLIFLLKKMLSCAA